jgi:mannose-6-phosphate isomerase-like protein (cupin superfamily)
MSEEPISFRPASAETATHYRWGESCDGWRLLDESSVSVNEERVPPGRGELWHSHDKARQFFYVLDGEAEIRTDQGTALLKAGEGAEVPPGLPHQFFNASPEPVRFLVISAPSARSDRRLLQEQNRSDEPERDDRQPPAGSSLT